MAARLAAADEAATELNAYFADVVESRRRAPGDDLVSDLIGVHDAGGDRLGAEELVSNLELILVAGSETTVNLLGNGLVALLAHPHVLAALRAEPGEIDRYVEEMLRYDPPVQVTWRWTGGATELAGYPLKPSASAATLIAAANRDPRAFVEPSVFDPLRYAGPQRSTPSPLSFGNGAHHCIGAALARVQAAIAFPALARRLPAIERAGAPERRDHVVLRGYDKLPICTGIPASVVRRG